MYSRYIVIAVCICLANIISIASYVLLGIVLEPRREIVLDVL
jgi:hypothetical protein